jgi:type IV secretory pathway VirB4 component
MSGILRLPSVTVTTRHSPVAYPWQQQHAFPAEGVLIGVNVLAGGVPLRYDPWRYYAANVISSPNMIVAGQLGRGKSALVKTYLSRQLAVNRQVYILDPKGEYRPFAEGAEIPIVGLRPGGSTRLNPLDPPPGATSDEQIVTARARVVAALAGSGLRRELTGEEHVAITATIRALPDSPTLGDVARLLFDPPPDIALAISSTATALASAIRPVAIELHRLLSGDLAGMFDGPSTVTPDPFGRGLVIDLSAVLNTDAQAAVMVAAGSWLSAAIDLDADRRRLLLVDEAWALLTHPATTVWLQQISKLARARGIQLITVIHRFSDLAAQADTGTATRAQAEGLLADAETRVLYGQAPGERQLATDLLGLTGPEADLVCKLPPCRALWRVGERVAVVDHIITDTERRMIDTDLRMQP